MCSHWLVLASLPTTHLFAPPGSWLWSRHPRTSGHLSSEEVTVVPGPCQMFPQCKDSGSLCWKTRLRAQKEVGFLVFLVRTGFATFTGGPGVFRADANPCTQPAISTGSLGLTGPHLPCTCYRGMEITRRFLPQVCCWSRERTWLGIKVGRGHKDKSHRQGTDKAKEHISRDHEQRDVSLQETGPEGCRVPQSY